MSLKSFLAGALTFLANIEGAAQPQAQAAHSSVSQALADIETAGNALADAAANDVLAKVPLGSELAPVVDDFIDSVVEKLLAKKSAPPVTA